MDWKTFSAPAILGESPSGEWFGEDWRYRYTLWRRWNWSDRGDRGLVAFIGVNPSTADAIDPDPTVTRCVNFAKSWGYDGMVMLNLFAWRDKDPDGMKAAVDPIGPCNDGILLMVTERVGGVVCCWGNNGLHAGRSRAVLDLLRHRELKCFKLTGEGEPWHPLYLAADSRACSWLRKPLLSESSAP